MTAVLSIISERPIQDELEIAWAAWRALCLAEVVDRSLETNAPHQLAKSAAQTKLQRLFDEWVSG